jgi:hypothetical protein
MVESGLRGEENVVAREGIVSALVIPDEDDRRQEDDRDARPVYDPRFPSGPESPSRRPEA